MLGNWEFLDYDVLFDLHERTSPNKFRLTKALFESHLRQSALLDMSASKWLVFNRSLVAAAAIKKAAPFQEPTQAHLSILCFQHFDAVRELMVPVVESLKAQGVQKLLFGQDSRHFFPGAPEDWTELGQILVELGFQFINNQVDLERDISTYEAPAGSLEALAGDEFVVRPCEASDLMSLSAFFEGEFPGRWKHDTLEKWNLDSPSTVIGLFRGTDCAGFALVQQDGTALPIGGAVWGQSLGASWGSLGPIGIAKDLRGRGLGDALLASALLVLQSRGARQTIIDWTTLVDYYGKHGFAVTRRYRSLVLDLT
ncbi:MAG: GNAT family N-acetyltransferase [Chthonomonas sp.]|nr:GNAT family N-acetyltransferase [Chthonomonas sp.]